MVIPSAAKRKKINSPVNAVSFAFAVASWDLGDLFPEAEGLFTVSKFEADKIAPIML